MSKGGVISRNKIEIKYFEKNKKKNRVIPHRWSLWKFCNFGNSKMFWLAINDKGGGCKSTLILVIINVIIVDTPV